MIKNYAPKSVFIVFFFGAMIILFSACSHSNDKSTAAPVVTPDYLGVTTGTFPVITRTVTATSLHTPIPSQPTEVLATPIATYSIIRNESTLPPVHDSLAGVHLENVNLEILSDIKQAGANWVRREIKWSKIEREEGNISLEDQTELDSEIALISKSGLQVIGLINNTPKWAVKSGFPCGVIADEKLDSFGDFVYQLVEKYSAPPYNIHYWELYNEPDAYGAFGCWGDPSDSLYFGGGAYAEMLKTAYPRIKQADPESSVLIGGLLLDCDPENPPDNPQEPGMKKDCTPSRFIEGILENGGGPYFDGVAFHAYDYYRGKIGQYGNSNWHSAWDITGSSLFVKASFLRRELNNPEYHLEPKFLMCTEAAVICEKCVSDPDFELTKAIYLSQINAGARAAQIRSNIWFSYAGWRNSGLISAEQQPLPVFYAFAYSAGSLDEPFTSVDEISISVDPDPEIDIYGFIFHGAHYDLWIIWSLDQETHLFSFPSSITEVDDVFGNSLMGQYADQNIPVSVEPVYIRSGTR